MAMKRRGMTPEAQQELPGVLPEVVKIVSLTRACRTLKTLRAAYQEAGMQAKEAGDRVRTLMHEHADKLKGPDGTLVYTTDGMSVELAPGKERIKIVTGDDDAGDQSDE